MGCGRFVYGSLALAFQCVFIILFAIFAEYDPTANAISQQNVTKPRDNDINNYYPMFQDVQVMMFVGFGFLMTFLRRYGFSSVGFNMALMAFGVQWSLLVGGFFSFIFHPSPKISINVVSLLNANLASACLLITFGAVLGKVSLLQLIIMAFIEIVCFKANEFIGLEILRVVDIGGSMFVHAFGAYFGLAMSRVLHSDRTRDHPKNGSRYDSDLFAMIGTLFLWMYWPSFNSALLQGDARHRAVINTVMSLCASCFTTFAVSSFVNKEAKFDMVHVQNSTLAGGVAIGTAADLMITPAGAVGTGVVAGTLSALGYAYLTPFLDRKFKIHDTCGVNNLHGMPGILAGLIAAIMASVASEDTYGTRLYDIFKARAPADPALFPMAGRTAGVQAGFQLAALSVTLGVAVLTGAITGVILRCRFLRMKDDEELFEDEMWWETPDDVTKADTDRGVMMTSQREDNTVKAIRIGYDTQDEKEVRNDQFVSHRL